MYGISATTNCSLLVDDPGRPVPPYPKHTLGCCLRKPEQRNSAIVNVMGAPHPLDSKENQVYV